MEMISAHCKQSPTIRCPLDAMTLINGTEPGASPAPRDAGARAAGPNAPRRTFAIISHPDAGKTTLTEKLLLSGGAIRLAGQVKARGERRRTRSDWMEIERARGISVTSSVMTFEHDGAVFNLLDTPGHEDFSEDTYRTLTAVDSAVMVIDAAKGIEAQTLKLFEVCRLRDIPIITFINKVDREGLDPLALLDEIQDKLALDASPMVWPVGQGTDFYGCYDIHANLFLTSRERNGRQDETVACSGPDDAQLDARVPPHVLAPFRESLELARSGYAPFAEASYREGHLTPVYFGSALKDFTVPQLLAALASKAPSPRPQPAEPAPVSPDDNAVSGFVFKVQANMDPNHRDRIAFFRLCSGAFKRGMKLKQARSGRVIAIHNPIFFFAQERELAEEARPGDIIGIPNHGTLRVGDTLSERDGIRFTGIPNFAPEILRRVRLDDPIKAKQLRRALDDLAEEGVVQVFRTMLGSQLIVGVVGHLQLDVLQSRLAGEYKISAGFDGAPYEAARWVVAKDQAMLNQFIGRHRESMAEDRDGAPVFFARSVWELNKAIKDWPDLRFSATVERS